MPHMDDLVFHVPSLALEDAVPHGWSADQYVAKVEAGDTTNASAPLGSSLLGFLGSHGRVMVVIGEPGVGKSMFLWLSGRELARRARAGPTRLSLRGPSDPCDAPWIPMLLELRLYRASELRGLFARVMASAGLSPEDIEGMRVASMRGASVGDQADVGREGGGGSGRCCPPLRLLIRAVHAAAERP
jgi:hypothetical protein